MDPKTVLAGVERSLQAVGPAPWLVGYDANGIQELIAASGRPITMRGASEVLLAFDREVRDREPVIFAGGGRGVVLARSAEDAQAKARDFVERFRKRTHGGVMAACAVPLQRGGQAEARSIQWLRHRLDLEKDAAHPLGGQLPAGKDSECAYCSTYRGVVDVPRDGAVERVCARCHAMLEKGRASGEMRLSIADIAEEGWIGVVSADGNNLGSLFESLHSLESLAAVSEAISSVFARAHEAALARVDEDQRVPLMTGGDDVRAFIPPSAVLSYVEALVGGVESASSAEGQAIRELISKDTASHLDQLGVGIGAVVANVYYPAWRLVEYAHELERSAKTACRAHAWRSGFDFAVITAEESMQVEPDQRPPQALPPGTAQWRAARHAASALQRIPKAQLTILSSSEDLSPEELGNVLRYQVARSAHWQGWYEARGADWRNPTHVIEQRPSRGLLELARLQAFQGRSA